MDNMPLEVHASSSPSSSPSPMPSSSSSSSNGISKNPLRGAVEIIPNRLYYCALQKPLLNEKILIRNPHNATTGDSSSRGSRIPVTCFNIDQELIYWNFFLDFGPLNLGQLYRFSVKLNTLLAQTTQTAVHNNEDVNGTEEGAGAVLFYSSTEDTKRANAIFLICAWQVLQLQRTPEDAFYGFHNTQHNSSPQQQPQSQPQSQQQSQHQQQAYQGSWCYPHYHYYNDNDEDNDEEDYDMVSSTCCVDSYHYKSSLQQQQQHQQHSSSSTNQQSKNHKHNHNRSQPPMSPLSIIGKHTVDTKLPPFHDASPYVCSYELTIIDCLTALMKAKQYQFFDWELSSPNNNSYSNSNGNGNQSYDNNNNNNGDAKFDIHEYEYFEQVENGDLNWIVKGRILAFAGPSYTKKISPEGYCTLSTQDYLPYFQRKNVGLVVRLNQKNYEESDFTSATPPIQHFEQYYTDGSVPTMAILQRILTAFETQCPQDKAFAVHCKAGLGRTGSCIGAWLMKHYRMTAKEVIGWMRICRPGMVIGPQQHFLQHIQPIMWQEGDMVRSLYPRNRLDIDIAMTTTVDHTMNNIDMTTGTTATTTAPMVLGTTTNNTASCTASSSAAVVVTPPRGYSNATTNASASSASSSQFQLRTPAEAMMLLSSSVDTITTSKDDDHNEFGHEVLLSGGGGCCGEEVMRMGGDNGADPGQADRLLAARVKQNRNQYHYHPSQQSPTCSSLLSISTTTTTSTNSNNNNNNNNNNESSNSSSDNNNNCSNSNNNSNSNNHEPMTQSLPVTPDNKDSNNDNNDNNPSTTTKSSSSSPSLWARAFA